MNPDNLTKTNAVSVQLADVEAEPVTWLWPGYLPAGKLVVVDGDPGLGKSVLSLDFAARVSVGKPWPDGTECGLGSVLLLSAEDGLADTIRPRLDAAGADVDQVHALIGISIEDAVNGRSTRPPAIPTDLPLIRGLVDEQGVTLVVVDVLMAYLDGDVNSYRDQDVRRALAPLATLAGETNACVLVLRHLNKRSGGPAVYRGGGSIGISGAARAVFLVGTDPADENRRVLAGMKLNLAPMPDSQAFHLVGTDNGHPRVEWLGPVTQRAEELLRVADPDEDEPELAGLIRAAVAEEGGCADAGKIIKQLRGLGYNERTIKWARKRAGVHTEKASFKGGWLWSL